MELIESVFLCAVFILGLNGLFSEGNILHFIAIRLVRLPWMIRKPLFQCMFCMSSVWGTIWYLLFVLDEATWGTFFMWPLFCILVAGTVRLFMFIGNYDVIQMD